MHCAKSIESLTKQQMIHKMDQIYLEIVIYPFDFHFYADFKMTQQNRYQLHQLQYTNVCDQF